MHAATFKYKGKLYASVKMNALWGIRRQLSLQTISRSLFIAIIEVCFPFISQTRSSTILQILFQSNLFICAKN